LKYSEIKSRQNQSFNENYIKCLKPSGGEGNFFWRKVIEGKME